MIFMLYHKVEILHVNYKQQKQKYLLQKNNPF